MMGPNINILIPYARAWVIQTYKLCDQDVIETIEQNLISKLISRLSESSDIKKIIVLSNDLNHLEKIQSQKVFIRPRSISTERISNRSELENLGRIEYPNQSFLMVNALFPMIALKTITKIHSISSNEITNVFLGAAGKCRDYDREAVGLSIKDMMWDFGAITAINDKSSSKQWKVFSAHTTVEVINVRRPEDMQQILQMLSLGFV